VREHKLLAFCTRFVSNVSWMDGKVALTILAFALVSSARAQTRAADFQIARINRDLITTPDYKGEYLAVQGPLNLPRSPQGHPVLIQAGDSPRGREFGARWGDVIFAIERTQADLQAKKDDLRDKARALGRDPVWLTRFNRPLSEAIGVPISEQPLLSEQGFPGHEDEAVELVRDLGRPGGATVVCSQAGVIPELVQRLAADADVELNGDLSVKKGGVWALSFYDHELVGAEPFPPPKTASQ